MHLQGTDNNVSYPGIVARITENAVSIRFPNLVALPKGATVGGTAVLKVANNCGVQTATCKVLEAEHTPIVYIKLAASQHLTITQNRKFFHLPLFVKAISRWRRCSNSSDVQEGDSH